ncbi:MAG: RHS repeat protein, partial [bacterium]|nr:RHS repeat protein [bacterium]
MVGGYCSFRALDPENPLVGMPIRVTRTYDTRRKDENLDFGQGWSIDYQNAKVEESRTPGKYWTVNYYQSGNAFAKNCIEPLGSPEVAVTLPDGRVERFEVRVSPECENFSVPANPVIVFRPMDGTQSELTVSGSAGKVYIDGGSLLDLNTLAVYNPDRYVLTTPEGYEFHLRQGHGLEHVKDPNGHVLSYTDNGILHSAGKSVTFARDGAGRIKEIIDPMGQKLVYTRDARGDLTAFTDRESNTVRYSYNSRHALTEIKDPLGRTPLR